MADRFLASVDGRLVLMDEEMHWPNFPAMATPAPCKCVTHCGAGIGAHPAGRCKGLPMDSVAVRDKEQS